MFVYFGCCNAKRGRFESFFAVSMDLNKEESEKWCSLETINAFLCDRFNLSGIVFAFL